MARRGITRLDLVRGEEGRRMLRVLSFLQHLETDHPWAHPLDGLVAYVDLIERRVLHLVDHELLPVPEEEGNFDDPAAVGPARTSLEPIQITRPEGPASPLDDEVTWEGWRLRIGFDAREGLTLHQLSLWDRPVLYRASIAEMMVPLGQQVVSLMLGCDCLGEIRHLDAVLPGGDGEPRQMPNAICLHEEDVGVAWKHNDLFTGSSETRRMRRLVISTFVAIGNYDHGFFWYLYLDGRIELEIKAGAGAPADRARQPARQRLHPAGHAAAARVRRGADRRRLGRPRLAGGQPGQDQPARPAGRLRPRPPSPPRCSPPAPAPPSPAGPPSPPGTCGSPATTGPSGTPPATCPTSIRGADPITAG